MSRPDWQQNRRQPKRKGAGATFHNPYHFVPVAPPPEAQLTALRDLQENTDAARHLSHDRYWDKDAEGNACHSGKIICRLTTKTPVVVGGKQEPHARPEQAATKVSLFELGDQVAIPGASLRGLISSVAEAASCSALRELDTERKFSFRKDMSGGMSALGMLVERDDPTSPTGKTLNLRPLTLPNLVLVKHDGQFFYTLTDPNVKEIRKRDRYYRQTTLEGRTIFPFTNLKVYFGDHEEITGETFLETYRSPQSEGASKGLAGPWYAMRLNSPGKRLELGQPVALVSKYNGFFHTIGGRMVVGQKARPATGEAYAKPVPYDAEKHPESEGWTKGIVRVLGVSSGRMSEIPAPTERRPDSGKRHEIFIPIPAWMEKAWENEELEFPIRREAIERFQWMADERTDTATDVTPEDELLPYHLHGTSRNAKGGGEKRLIPKHGDIVFFEPTGAGDEVAEFAYSSIWRDAVKHTNEGEPGEQRDTTAGDFFAAVSPDLLPVGAHPDKANLTLAEKVFGFVGAWDKPAPDATKEDKPQRESLALAGRVRFSPALPFPGKSIKVLRDQGPLKILDSPKPPSPNFYFRQEGRPNFTILKRQLNLGGQGTGTGHLPMGRKFYLHHREDQVDAAGWNTLCQEEGAKQRSVVDMIAKEQEFYFEVGFDNLSDVELGMLLYALNPGGSFQYKLGLGKPIGLGSVQIEALAWLEIDRGKRYGQDDFLNGPRYHDGWALEGETNRAKVRELVGIGDDDWSRIDWSLSRERLKEDFAQQMEEHHSRVLVGLELLGDPGKVQAPVHYPQVAGEEGKELELKTYVWFSRNDGLLRKGPNREAQRLKPLDTLGSHDPLPTLERR